MGNLSATGINTALITGASGFLGQRIVTLLVEQGIKVRTLQRRAIKALRWPGTTITQGDIRYQDTVIRAAQNCDIIFHVASKAGVWGSYQDYYQSNVIGTRNILEACRVHRISKLIYTSSPSVVFSGTDEENINETVPYPRHFLSHYQQTKAQAEQMVLQANNLDLATIALRPHLIWGPGDPHLLPRLIKHAKTGRLRRLGTKDNLVDATYIDNAAQAHILAAQALNSAAAVGRAYFISNGEPLAMTELINRLLATANLPAISKTIPASLAYGIGTIMEIIYRLLPSQPEPLMTRFIARQLSCAHYYDLTAARQQLGYRPTVSIAEGLARLKQSLQP